MNPKSLLSSLWIFLVVNFIFCDIFTLMHAPDLRNMLSGTVDGMPITQEFLLFFGIMMEIPMLMILLSRLLPAVPNRIANLAAGVLMAVIQGWSLTVGELTLHYIFFSVIEIAACAAIIWIAWKSRTITQRVAPFAG